MVFLSASFGKGGSRLGGSLGVVGIKASAGDDEFNIAYTEFDGVIGYVHRACFIMGLNSLDAFDRFDCVLNESEAIRLA